MTHEEASRSLVDAIRFVQEQSGRELQQISIDTRPFEDLEGFDSLNALEVLVEVGESAAIEIPDKLMNRLAKEVHSTVSEWADGIISVLQGDGSAGE